MAALLFKLYIVCIATTCPLRLALQLSCCESKLTVVDKVLHAWGCTGVIPSCRDIQLSCRAFGSPQLSRMPRCVGVWTLFDAPECRKVGTTEREFFAGKRNSAPVYPFVSNFEFSVDCVTGTKRVFET